jgi:hypothetical protein
MTVEVSPLPMDESRDHEHIPPPVVPNVIYSPGRISLPTR